MGDDAIAAHLDCLWLGEGLVTGELRHFDHPVVFHKGLGLRSDGFDLVTLKQVVTLDQTVEDLFALLCEVQEE